jgi:hypothetical protein
VPATESKLVDDSACLLFGEPDDDSGANPQVVLAVVETIWDFGHEVLGLRGANGDVSGHLDINAATRGHRKIIFGA